VLPALLARGHHDRVIPVEYSSVDVGSWLSCRGRPRRRHEASAQDEEHAVREPYMATAGMERARRVRRPIS
jgi:hypothetical protein